MCCAQCIFFSSKYINDCGGKLIPKSSFKFRGLLYFLVLIIFIAYAMSLTVKY